MNDKVAVKKYSVIKTYLLVFFICFIPRLIFCIFAMPVRTQSDEFSTMFFASKLAGLQWDEVMEYANYYGFGMNLFTWWIYKLPLSPIVKYKCLLGFCAILQSLIGVVCLKILRVLNIPQINQKISVSLSVVCSFVVFTRHTVYYNEHALMLITWVIALLLVNLIMNNTKKNSKIINSILLAVVLSYAFLVHTRSLTYVLALIVLEVLYFIIYRKSLIHIRGFLGVFVIVYIGAKGIVNWYQGNFWTEGFRALTNASIPDVSGVQLNVRNLFMMAKIILSQFTTISILTGGVCLIGIVVLAIVLFKELFLKGEKLHGGKRALFVIGLYTLMCAVATSLYQSLSWGMGVVNAIYNGGDLYPLKALTYIRYMGPYIGVVFCVGLVYILSQEFLKVKRLYMMVFALFIVLLIWWSKSIVPVMSLTGATSEAFSCFVFEKNFIAGAEQFMAGIVLTIMMASICFFLLLREKRKWIITLIGLFLIYQYMYNATVYDVQVQRNKYELVNASYELFCGLEAEDVPISKEIYVVDESGKTDHMFFFPFQIYMENYVVHPAYPKEAENVILITNSYKKTKKNIDIKKYTVFKLDKNEFLYTNNLEVVDYLRVNGYAEK